MNNIAARILLVEDNQSDREFFERELRKAFPKMQLTIAVDGDEVLKMLFGGDCVHGGPAVNPDLIVLDLKMPKRDGLEVLRTVKAFERTRYIPVVVMSASAEDTDIMNSYRMGASSYIQKPMDYTEFVALIPKMIEYWLCINYNPGRAGISS